MKRLVAAAEQILAPNIRHQHVDNLALNLPGTTAWSLQSIFDRDYSPSLYIGKEKYTGIGILHRYSDEHVTQPLAKTSLISTFDIVER